MLVICPKCAASYNVPDEKIPEAGARTKCASCGTSFRIEKVPQDLMADQAGDDPFAPSTSVEEPPAAPGDDVSDLFGSSDDLGEGAANEDLTPTLVFDPTASDKRMSQAAAGKSNTSPARSKNNYPDFDWADEAESVVPGLIAGGPASAEASDPFSASLFQPALDESHGRYILGKKPQRTSSGGVNVRHTVSKQRRTVTFYILMALIAGGGAYVATNIDKYAAINWQELYFLALESVGLPSPRPVVKPIVIGASVRKVYEETTMAGDKLLVVEGLAQNLCDTPQEKLSVTVTLIDDSGSEITSRTVYAGNELNSIQLKTLPLAQVFAMQERPLGAALLNTNIQPQATIAFQAVFFPAPTERNKIAVTGRSAQSPALPFQHLPSPALAPAAPEPTSGVAATSSDVTNAQALTAAPEAVSTP